MSQFEYAIAATRGARDNQEDTAAYWPGGDTPFISAHAAAWPSDGSGLAVLADGMGGHAAGALASRMVCEEFITAAIAPVATPNIIATTDRLRTALDAANAALAGKVAQNPMLSGMGSTVIGVAFGRAGVEWVSVGDSPLYLFRRGELAVLNEDHSCAPEIDRLVAAGQLTELEARRHPRRHMLRSAVSGDDIDLIDISGQPLALEPDDYVILASDGIATLETGEIGRIIQAYATDGAKSVATALIRAVDALREPHQDNATVVVVRAIA